MSVGTQKRTTSSKNKKHQGPETAQHVRQRDRARLREQPTSAPKTRPSGKSKTSTHRPAESKHPDPPPISLTNRPSLPKRIPVRSRFNRLERGFVYLGFVVSIGIIFITASDLLTEFPFQRASLLFSRGFLVMGFAMLWLSWDVYRDQFPNRRRYRETGGTGKKRSE